ncbi:Hypp5656 [Branchiostoma lanceolatum]|uniref:Hypp5656 protein n=1 Tax=Branchiostoma lanceolatum TaxID=7740 RepID=A0A8J9YNK1_BRALA|nr:Hypp5656 [Branchiostoma lanceolatum]
MAAGSDWSKHHSRMPRFNMKEKTYEPYRFELECWNAVTTLGKTRRGIEIMLSLPESSEDPEYKTREFLSSKLDMPELTSENSFANVLKQLDEHLRVDETGRLWESFVAFDQFSRGSLPMSEYISKFDVLYNTLNKCGHVTLPASVLGLLLVRRANLSPAESKLVMTGLDYTKETALYTQAKASLRKFSSELMTAHSSNPFAMPMMKHEVHVAEQQTFQASRGRYVPGATGQYKPGRYKGRGRGGFRFQDGGAHGSRQGEGTFNPKNKYGDYYRCHCCGSFRHMLEKCPDAKTQKAHVTKNEAESEDTQFAVLFTGASKCLMSELSTEASLCAVLDSACSSTVCGMSWMKKYLSVLDTKHYDYVKEEASTNVFKFGGGERLPSLGKFSIPAKMAGQDVMIVTDVVDSDIPLLLSLDAMKRADIVLHTREDRATIFGKSVNLNLTTSGHYCVSLVNQPIEVSEVLQVDLGEDVAQARKKLLHLHRQFAHPNVEKLTELLQGANAWRSHYAPILQEICQSCDVCKRFKRGAARPVVALPKSTRFNQVVAMDLKKWGSQYLLYFVDEFSRLTVAKRIARKYPKDVVEAFMELWMACGYGIPEQIMVDNGVEFTAAEIMEFSSKLNIKVNTTAGHSPFSNGVCERNHAVMDVMLEKLAYENPNTPIDQLIAWACTAKNAMAMFAGYSPYQIVFGRNPVLPGFETHPPSTNEVKGDVLLKHLTALAAARKAFTEAESSERVRRALHDFLYGGDELFEEKIISPLAEKYHTSRQESGTFTYVGISVVQENDKVTIHQNKYLQGLTIRPRRFGPKARTVRPQAEDGSAPGPGRFGLGSIQDSSAKLILM